LVRFVSGRSRLSAVQAVRSIGLGAPSPVSGTGYFLVPTAGRAPRQAVAVLKQAPGVAWAGLNYLYEAFAIRYGHSATGPVYPNDPLFPNQVLDQLGFPYAWSITKGLAKDTIAIVDTGVQASHPDLAGRVGAGHNCISATAPPADDNGHGTMVAGAAAADTNNGLDISGAAWEAGIQPVKVLDSQGIGTAAQVACGITWAADHGASVINLSLGGPVSSPMLHSAVDYALSKNVVVVAAAGNGAAGAPMYPAAYPGVLAVTAEGGTDWPIGFDWFSSYGWWVGLAAPGIDIQGTQLGGGVALGTGTSMAAPFARPRRAPELDGEPGGGRP
jgi:subtilisin family serine protease